MQLIIDGAQYNHQLIVLGRESRAISQSEMARLLNFSQGKLSKVENGLITLTNEELIKVAEVLSYPVQFFQRNERIYGMGLSEFFHRKQQSVPQKHLQKIYARLEIRRMEIQSLLKSVDIGESNFFFMDPDKYDGDVEKIAQIVRATWHLPNGPVHNVIEIIEDAGGIVVPFDFEGSKVDAISLCHPGSPPIIFFNYERPMDRIRFTLCHEIGHLIMHQRPPSVDQDIESQADRFASEFLMPKADISHQLNNINLKVLASLKPYWKVSMAALLKRATDIGKLTERQSRYLWTQMGKAGYRAQEPSELEPPREMPSLLNEILKTHYEELKYTVSDLSSAVTLNEAEFKSLYSPKHSHLRLVR